MVYYWLGQASTMVALGREIEPFIESHASAAQRASFFETRTACNLSTGPLRDWVRNAQVREGCVRIEQTGRPIQPEFWRPNSVLALFSSSTGNS